MATAREQWAQEFGRRSAAVAAAELVTEWTSILANEADTDEELDTAGVADVEAWAALREAKRPARLF